MELLKSSEGNDQVINLFKKGTGEKNATSQLERNGGCGLLNRLYCKVGEKNVKSRRN